MKSVTSMSMVHGTHIELSIYIHAVLTTSTCMVIFHISLIIYLICINIYSPRNTSLRENPL